MNKITDADLKFDGYVQATSGPRVPCDVQIWLPTGPAEDASISVFLNGDAEAVMGHGGVQITSKEHVERQGLKFLAEDVLIGASKAQPGFRDGGAQLTITHVGRWVIHRVRKSAECADDHVEYVSVSLSALRYGAQRSAETVGYTGTREIRTFGQPKKLLFFGAAGASITWELQKHWTWKSQKKDGSVSAYPTPVICATDGPPLITSDLPRLRTCAEDTCLLLRFFLSHKGRPPPGVALPARAGSLADRGRSKRTAHR